MTFLWVDQFKKLRQRPLETCIMSVIVFVITLSFIAIHPLSSQLDDPVDDYLEAQAVEDFHITMGMIDFNHLTGSQRLDVYQTMNLYSTFPALDENDPYEMNQINMAITSSIYQYPELIDRLYDSMIDDGFDDDAFTVEKRLRLHLVDGTTNYLLMTVNEMVNVPYLTEGRLPNEGEIALLAPFKEAHDLAVGDTYTIQGHSFTISGFFYAPDYILPALNSTNLQFEAERDAIVLTHPSTLLSFNAPFRVDYQVIGDFSLIADDYDIYDILSADLHVYGRNMQMVETVVPRDLNYRINAIQFESAFTEAFVYRFLAVFFVLSLAVFLFYVKRLVDRQKNDLVMLRKLGYSQRSLVYSMGAIIIVYGGVMLLATILGIITGYAVFDTYIARYAMPHPPYTFPYLSVLIGCLIPFILLSIFILSYAAYHMTKLLRPSPVTKASMVATRIRHIVVEMSIFIVISSMILIAVLSSHLISGFKEDSLEGKQFESMIYYYNYQSDPLDDTQEAFIHHAVTVTKINDNRVNHETTIQGYGISPDTTLLHLKKDTYNVVPLLTDQTVVFSQNAARLYGIQAGDNVIIRVGYVQSSFVVLAVIDEWMERSIYLTDETMLEMVGYDDMSLYNGMFSETLVEGDSGVFRHLQYRAVADQIEMMFYTSNALIGAIMGLSIILASVMLYFFIYDRLQFASAYLLTLRALGYTIKETYVVFFKTMFFVFIISFILALFIARMVISAILDYVYSVIGFTFPLTFEGLIIFAVFMGMSLVFLGSTYSLHKAVANQPLSTLLKKV